MTEKDREVQSVATSSQSECSLTEGEHDLLERLANKTQELAQAKARIVELEQLLSEGLLLSGSKSHKVFAWHEKARLVLKPKP